MLLLNNLLSGLAGGVIGALLAAFVGARLQRQQWKIDCVWLEWRELADAVARLSAAMYFFELRRDVPSRVEAAAAADSFMRLAANRIFVAPQRLDAIANAATEVIGRLFTKQELERAGEGSKLCHDLRRKVMEAAAADLAKTRIGRR